MKAITENLIGHLLGFDDCSGLDLIVSFIKLSGYRMIEQMLFSAKKNHIPVRILTLDHDIIVDYSRRENYYENTGEYFGLCEL